MTERKKDLLYLTLLLAVLILAFSKILFTHQIIRAPDIINEFYWGVEGIHNGSLLEAFRIDLSTAGWNQYINSGHTNEGGMVSGQFLFWNRLIFSLFPPPASVAWFIVLHLFFGAAGVYCYCRAIGCSRPAAFLGGLVFAVAPENASLINAGHVMKIATISFAPWAFYFFEKGFQTRRAMFFLATGVVLAFQFFNTHWQIAFYTCLGVGVYALLRLAGIAYHEWKNGRRELLRLFGLNLATMLFFLTTVAISLVPLAHWSTETNRGIQSGGNAGKGGLSTEEAMMWSLPPEEVVSFVVPGLFGLSRQEAGANPTNIPSYYWGRMVFTQTTDYMGLLPWLLLPLPLLFRRDKYTWLALAAVAGGLIFSMGKYTPVYPFLFEHFPGINHFRVPKMMMFMVVLGLGVLAARGFDCLFDEGIRATKTFKKYLAGICVLPIALLLLLGIELVGKDFWLGVFYEILAQPTRYEQGLYLVGQRWSNLLLETAIAVLVAAICAAVFLAVGRKRVPAKIISLVFVILLLVDVGRINDKFMFLVKVPEKVKGGKTPVIDYLSKGSNLYRVLPMDGSDPMQYATNQIPVMFTSNPVQQRRWQEFLDGFSLSSAMPDMLNVKYFVYGREQYAAEKAQLGERFVPVFTSPDGATIVLENRRVLPKGWLVPAVITVTDLQQSIGILQHPAFDPKAIGLVESPPPIPLADPNRPAAGSVGAVDVTRYEGVHVVAVAKVTQNALLVLGEKYYQGWRATVDGKAVTIYPVNHVLRGVYLTPGSHTVEFVFDPLSFKIGKYLTLASFVLFAAMLGREAWVRRRESGTRG